VLVDGVRIGSSTTGAANWSAIPLSAIDHIEIVYGPLSSLYGADAIGGVIQIFTKKGRARRVTAFAGYGSDNTAPPKQQWRQPAGLQLRHQRRQEIGRLFRHPPCQLLLQPDRDGYDKNALRPELRMGEGQEIGTQFLHSSARSTTMAQHRSTIRTIAALNTVAFYSRNQLLPNWLTLVQYSERRDDGQTYQHRRIRLLAHRHQADQLELQNDIDWAAMLHCCTNAARKKSKPTAPAHQPATQHQLVGRFVQRAPWRTAFNAASAATTRCMARKTPARWATATTSALPCAPPPATAPASGADLQRAVLPRLRQRGQQAGARQERRNRHPLG
jgi:outer membrane cobalamin receptor